MWVLGIFKFFFTRLRCSYFILIVSDQGFKEHWFMWVFSFFFNFKIKMQLFYVNTVKLKINMELFFF